MTAVGKTTDDLIDMIYAALLGETSWQAFIDRLSTSVPNGKTFLVYHDADRSRGFASLSAGIDQAPVVAYNGYFSGINPWMPRASVRRIGLGVVADQMLEREALLRSEFYNDWLRPLGCESAVGVTIDRDEGRSFLLTSLTSQADADANRVHADRLTRLAPHMRRAADFYRREWPQRYATELGASLFDALQMGALVIGEGGRYKAISRTGERLLAETSIFHISPLGKLRCRSEQLQRVLRSMLERHHTGPKIFSAVFDDMRITLARMETDQISLLFEGPTVVVLMEPLAGPSPEKGFDLTAIANDYGLTTAETRALAGIIGGRTIEQMAHGAQRSPETIRSQVKSLFAKTGTHSQADIVRLAASYAPGKGRA